MNRMTLTGIVATALFAGSVLAQDAAGIRVVTVAEKEEVFVDASGERRAKLVDAATVVPGDQVIYTITFTNESTESASNVTITDPVPDNLAYVHGSAFGPGTDIKFSVNDGASWDRPENLTITLDDGTQRPAQAQDYTHVRWTMRNELPAGAQGFARFRAQLR